MDFNSIDTNIGVSEPVSQPIEDNRTIADKIGLEGLAKQNPEVAHLVEMLNSQNMSFDEFVANDPELAKTMKMLTEDNIRLDVIRPDDDEDIENDPDDEIETDDFLSGASVSDIAEEEASAPTEFVENTETSAEVSNDLNSIF